MLCNIAFHKFLMDGSPVGTILGIVNGTSPHLTTLQQKFLELHTLGGGGSK